MSSRVRAKTSGGHRRRWAAWLALACLHFTAAAQPAAPSQPISLEGYPTELAEALLRRKQAEDAAIKNTSSPGLFSFVATNFAWPNGTKLIVAFQGGNFDIWRDIASIATQWSAVANISFDFGLDPIARKARTYGPGDPPSVAQVRIDLTASDARLRWSAVGRQALQSEFNRATMQLGALAQMYPLWTAEDKADVLHEFGHVLGFLHEQQRPECKADYRLEPGPNGEPTIYEVYLRAYNVPRAWTEANLFLANAYIVSGSAKPDKRSLFLYPTPDEIVPGTIQGTKGPCYIKEKNKQLSADDIKRARRDYPFKPGNAFSGFITSNIAPLKALASTQGLAAMSQLTEKLERLELAARPLVYVQVASEEDRKVGEQLRRALLQRRYIAPGVENIARKAKPPKTAEIRYFSPADQQAANDVAALVTDELGSTAAVPIKLIPRDTTKKQPLEIWLPAR